MNLESGAHCISGYLASARVQGFPMRSMLSLLLVSLSLIAWPATAAEFGTKDEAVAMVKRVQAKFKAEGAEATFKAVSDKSVAEFHDRDLYPFIYDM